MSATTQIGLFQKIGMGLWTFAKAGTTRVDIIQDVSLPPLDVTQASSSRLYLVLHIINTLWTVFSPACLPNSMANLCLRPVRDLCGARIVTAIHLDAERSTIAAYDVKAKKGSWLATLVKVVLFIPLFLCGMTLRALSVYNEDVRNALRADLGWQQIEVTPPIEENKTTETVQTDLGAPIEVKTPSPIEKNKITETDDFFDFSSVKPGSSQSKPVHNPCIGVLSGLLAMNETEFEQTLKNESFVKGLLQASAFPNPTFEFLYPYIKEKAKLFDLDYLFPIEITPEQFEFTESGNYLIFLLQLSENNLQHHLNQQSQELKQRLTLAAALVSQASRWMFFQDSKTASLQWSLAGLYGSVKSRFERLGLQEHLPKQDAIEAEIQRQQKEEAKKAMMQLFMQGKKT